MHSELFAFILMWKMDHGRDLFPKKLTACHTNYKFLMMFGIITNFTSSKF